MQTNLLLPDKDILWLPFAKSRAKKLAQQEHFDLVFVSGSPFSSFAIAKYLKDTCNLPFILDFRDEWINNQTRLLQKVPAWRNRVETRMEKQMIESASGVTYVSKPMCQNFHQAYPSLQTKPEAVITNGFDEEDFISLQLKTQHYDYLRIIYTGSFYDTTRPQPFLQALLDLMRSGAIPREKLRLEIYGKNTPSFIFSGLDATSEELSFVHLFPYVPHKQSLQLQVEADLLLIYIITAKNTDAVYNGKSFEYIRSGTPIYAICPPKGLAADLVRATKTGWIADSADQQAIKDGFLECFRKWQNRELTITPDIQEIQKYERHNQTGQLVSLMNEVLESKEA
jgi:glycosyltransferase involved in cell wall biosynthesis